MSADDLAKIPSFGVEDPQCTCGHLMTVHAIGTRGSIKVRTACSASTCQCRIYQENQLQVRQRPPSTRFVEGK